MYWMRKQDIRCNNYSRDQGPEGSDQVIENADGTDFTVPCSIVMLRFPVIFAIPDH